MGKNFFDGTLESCGLEIHQGKTRIVYCADSNRKLQHDLMEFTFLGYSFHRRREKNKQTNEIFDGFQPAVSNDALKSMKRVIKNDWRLKSMAHLELADIAAQFNPVIRGWINYYGRFCEEALVPLANHINERLRLWAAQKYERLRGNRGLSYDWLRKAYQSSPKLFAHWEVFRVY